MKSTAIAYANQALVKYWGKTNSLLKLPYNSSISVCLDKLTTKTTIEFSKENNQDEVFINNEKVYGRKYERVVNHLNLIRKKANNKLKAKVFSINSFPASTGLASSASGFAALTVAARSALGLDLGEKEMSILSRQGSGSSCRSITGGFSKWTASDKSEESYAICLAKPEEIDMRTIIALVKSQEKKVGSTKGMEITVNTCPFFKSRINYVGKAIKEMEQAIKNKDACRIGELAEKETLNMHACMLTSYPPLIYWTSETIKVIKNVLELREQGVKAYFSIDAGSNVFINTTKEFEKTVEEKIKNISGVVGVIKCKVGGKPFTTKEHLF